MSPRVPSSDIVSLQPATVAVWLLVQGRVQGVGFRPAVARLAVEFGLNGHVANTTQGVEITIEGEPAAVEQFANQLVDRLPPLAHVNRVEQHDIPVRGMHSFQIGAGSSNVEIAVSIAPDLCSCHECLSDVADPANRRFGYPLASCTACGPRYSILESLPYEREATAMAGFVLCLACRREYQETNDRRFHAQTNACQQCGPRCWCVDASGRRLASDDAAISWAVRALRAGQIIAIKGLGGYQLLVDATNEKSVARLRSRKQRPDKPLAVLVDSLATAESLADLTADERVALAGPAGPIVVVSERRPNVLAGAIAPGLDAVGLMLPTTPLHWLLARDCPPLVATSGNLEGEPLSYDESSAQERLAGIADCLLHQNRPILQPVDDSVVRVIAGCPVTLRLGRGLAPLPIDFGSLAKAAADRPLLAVGGQQKNAIAIFNGVQAVLGPHVGDLDDLATRQRFDIHVASLCRLLGTEPAAVACDQHPDYYTTHWAAGKRLPMLAVQHHHAHVAVGMIEHGWLDRDVLGVAWDGTGYGPDGTIWGGEFLVANAATFRRVARLRPLRMVGGEAAIRQPWRIALAILSESVGQDEAMRVLRQRGFAKRELSPVLGVLRRPYLAPLTTSAGRLFDGIAALLLPLELTKGGRSSFEGQIAMFLESAAGQAVADTDGAALHHRVYPFPLVTGEPAELDWRPLVTAIVDDMQAGVDTSVIARRFHASLACAILNVADEHRDLPVVLGGGVFQNRLLVEELARRFANRPQPLGLPGKIPPNDGGLAAGQLAIALAQLTSSDR